MAKRNKPRANYTLTQDQKDKLNKMSLIRNESCSNLLGQFIDVAYPIVTKYDC